MKLLLDENLSPALVEILAEIYPETVHVRFGNTLRETAIRS